MADNEMVERVARALCWANGMDPDLTLGGDGQNYLWMEYEHPARAAIAAMREPTTAMMQSACEIYCTEPTCFKNGGCSFNRHTEHLEEWQAMIDAALPSPPEGTDIAED